MHVECFGASLAQDGRRANEDAWAIGHGGRGGHGGHGGLPYVALADGAGNAEQAAAVVLRRFRSLFAEAGREDVELFATWQAWARALDSLLVGRAQSTFLAVALLEERVVGACVGDSRAYLRDREGAVRDLTAGAAKHRLGSGAVEPFPIHERLAPGEMLVLLSDGAWTPLGLYRLGQALARHALGAPADVPSAILTAAARTGRPDDMTALVALRRR